MLLCPFLGHRDAAVTGLADREAYKDIFIVILTKTAAVFVVIAIYYMTGLY